jgi:hypothetical protein
LTVPPPSEDTVACIWLAPLFLMLWAIEEELSLLPEFPLPPQAARPTASAAARTSEPMTPRVDACSMFRLGEA